MKILKPVVKSGLVLTAIFLLSACGGNEPPAGKATVVKKPSAGEPGAASSHTITGMKKALDDARGVEDILQKHAEDQRKQIDDI